jgi:hypothetical protein
VGIGITGHTTRVAPDRAHPTPGGTVNTRTIAVIALIIAVIVLFILLS